MKARAEPDLSGGSSGYWTSYYKVQELKRVGTGVRIEEQWDEDQGAHTVLWEDKCGNWARRHGRPGGEGWRDHCFYYYTSVVQHPATCLGRHGVISLPHPTRPPQNSNIYERVHINQQTTGKQWPIENWICYEILMRWTIIKSLKSGFRRIFSAHGILLGKMTGYKKVYRL